MTADNLTALPELPTPQKECWIGHDLYSAEQMHAYARAYGAALLAARDAEDSKRLDWLDAHRQDEVQRGRDGEPELLAHAWYVMEQAGDIRSALDNAMSREASAAALQADAARGEDS
jgi:hypothetical protein